MRKLTEIIKKHPRIAVLTALLLLLAGHIASNLWWLANDHHLFCYDEMWHVNHTRNYINALNSSRGEGLVPMIVAVSKAYSWFYPPLLYLGGVIPPVLGWNSLDGISFTNTAYFCIFIVGIYLLARTVLERNQAFLAAFVAGFLPAMFSVSRLHLTDMGSAAVVVLCLWALVRSDRFLNTRWVFVFALFNGLGFLSRQFTFVFYAAPIAIAVGAGIVEALGIGKDRRFDKELSKTLLLNVALTVVVTIGIAAPWYLLHLEDVFKFANRFEDRWETKHADNPVNPLPGILFRCINDGVFLPTFLMGLAGVAVAARRLWRNLPFVLISSWLLGTIVLKVLFPWTGCAPRHLLPLYPAFVLPAVFLLFSINRRSLRVAAIAAYCTLLVFQFVNLTFFSFGPVGELKIPVFAKHPMTEWSHDGGLIVYSDLIFASGAMYHAAQREDNWAQRVLDEIVEREVAVQYTGTVEGNIQALRIDKTYIEFIQAESWPGANPLHENPGNLIGVPPPCVPIHPETGPVKSTVVQSDTGTYCVETEYPLYSSMVEWDYGNHPQLTVPFPSGAGVDMFTLAFRDPALAPWEYSVQYRETSGGELRDFSPPVRWRGPRRACHLHRFERVRPAELVFTMLQAPPASNGALCDVAFFQNVIQQRPPKIAGFNEYNYGPGKLDPEQLGKMTYVIAQDELEPEYLNYLSGFEVIDEFTINGEGRPGHFFDDHHVRLFARRQAPLLSYHTSPAFQACVTSDLHPNGRWDLPFWRWNDRNFPINPRNEKGAIQYSWTCRLPAILDIKLGSHHELHGAALIPHTPEYGLTRAQGQYWDGAQGAWRDLGADRPFLLSPYHQQNAQVYHMPEMWTSPVVTDRLRFLLLEGGSGAPQVGYLHNVFVYGSPSPGKDASMAAIEDKAKELFEGEAYTLSEAHWEQGDENLWSLRIPVEMVSNLDKAVEFGATSMDDGSLAIGVNGVHSLYIPNGSRQMDYWTNEAIALAFRPDEFAGGHQVGFYRLRILDAERLSLGGRDALLTIRFIPGTPLSEFLPSGKYATRAQGTVVERDPTHVEKEAGSSTSPITVEANGGDT